MKKIIIASLLGSALAGCVSVYEAPRPSESAPACSCSKDDNVRIYKIKNGRWYRLRDGICPCVDRP